MKTVSVDELRKLIGQEVGVSEWFQMTQDAVNKFADLTIDHQFIHVDQEKAAETPLGGTIAHGFFTLSMLSFFNNTGAGIAIEGTKMGFNYGCNKIRFIHPVSSSAKIRGRSILVAVEKKEEGQYLITSEMTVEIEGVQKPALIAEWLAMVIV